MPIVWVKNKAYSVESEVEDYVEQLEEKNKRLKDKQEKAIPLIDKALGLIYDTMHPMPKAAISSALVKIREILKRE